MKSPTGRRLNLADTPEYIAWLCAIGTVLCWSSAATAFKLTLNYTSPLVMLWIASCSSAILLTAVGGIRPAWRIGRVITAFGSKRSALLKVLPLALLNPVSYYLILFAAYDRLPGQLAQPLNYTWPIVLLLLQCAIYKRRLTALQIIALMASFFGVIWIATQGNPLRWNPDTDPWGVGLALGSTLFWSFYWILNSHYIKHYKLNPVALLASAFWLGSIILTVILVVVMMNQSGTQNIHTLNGPALVGGLYVGIFEMGLAFLLWQIALSASERPAILGNIIYFTPFGSLLVLSIFVEKIHPSSWVGLVFIVLGIILQALVGQRSARAN